MVMFWWWNHEQFKPQEDPVTPGVGRLMGKKRFNSYFRAFVLYYSQNLCFDVIFAVERLA